MFRQVAQALQKEEEQAQVELDAVGGCLEFRL